MKSIRLKLERCDLQNALNTLGVTRRRRFSSIVPVWLYFDTESKLLQIVEDKGAVTAYVPAEGQWPYFGATIDLYTLKRALKYHTDAIIELHTTKDAVLLANGNWQMKMHLLKFGPDNVVPGYADALNVVPGHADDPLPLADLPLFGWAQPKR